MSEYPKWKYQGTQGRLVESADEEAALGEGFADAPTEAAKPSEQHSGAADDGGAAVIAELEAAHAELKTDNAAKAARIAELEAVVASQTEQIAKLTAAAEAKGKK